MGTIGTQGIDGTPQELSILISWLDASGGKVMLDSCQETASPAVGSLVRCTYDFYGLRSDEIGLGPYTGSYFDLTVRDGQITRASQYWETQKFSPQMWEPFARWVSRTYPDDAAVMYQDSSRSVARPTQESIGLWERPTRGYVMKMKQGQ